jgi:hypothetical protein
MEVAEGIVIAQSDKKQIEYIIVGTCCSPYVFNSGGKCNT